MLGRRLRPRLRGRPLGIVSLVLVLVLAVTPARGGLAVAATEPGSAEGQAEKVLIVSLPTLRWADVSEHEPPVLTDLLADSAVASLSVRTIGTLTRLGDAYATIGAGNRARAPEELAGLAFPPGHGYRGEEVADVFARRCGCAVSDAAVVHLGAGAVVESNRRLRYGAEPGALAAALAQAGLVAAVVANADPGLEGQPHREAALAVMDGDGRVTAGTVGPALLTVDPAAPFGRRTDVGATVAAFAGAWEAADVVLLELADLERADRYASLATPAAAHRARSEALARADAVLGEVLSEVDGQRHLVMVVAPTEPRGLPVELTVAAVAGPGFPPGLASSGTTRRGGYVTLPDLAPTVLGVLGVEVPTAMNGAPIAAVGGPRPGPELYEDLAGDNRQAVFRNQVTGPVTVAFIVLQVLTYALAAVALRAGNPRLRRASGFLALTVLAACSVAFLSGLVRYAALGPVGYPIAFFAAAVVLAGGAWAVGRRLERRRERAAGEGPPAAPLLLAGLLLAVLVVDVAVGGPLQIDTVFGYSPVVAGRFAGYGNLAFGLVAMSAIVVGTGAWGWPRPGPRQGGDDGEERRRPGGRGREAAVAGLFAVTILAIGLPSLGMDVGGVLSAVPAFVVTLGVLRGEALGWRRLAATAGATLVVIAAFGAVDLQRPAASRTHLGRFLARIGEPGPGGAITVIERKIASNLTILTSSLWTLVIPVAIAFLAFLAWRQGGLLRRLEVVAPGTRACLVGGLVVAVLGALLNDSGIAIPGIMFAVLLPYLSVLALAAAEAPDPGGET